MNYEYLPSKADYLSFEVLYVKVGAFVLLKNDNKKIKHHSKTNTFLATPRI